MPVVSRVFRALVAGGPIVACSTALQLADQGGDAGAADGGIDGAADGLTPGEGGEIGDAGVVLEPACALSASRPLIDFGESLAGGNQMETVTLQSFSANSTVVAVTANGAGFSTDAGSIMVPAGGKQTVGVSHASTNVGNESGTLAMKWGAGCTLDVGLKAKTLPPGSYAFTPGTVDLGSHPCGSDPPDGVLTVNVPIGAAAAPWTGGATSPFSILPVAGTFTAGSSTQILVQTGILPVMPLDVTGTVTLDITNQPQRMIPVIVRSRGATLTFNNTDVHVQGTEVEFVTVTNGGNDTVAFSVNIPSPFGIVGNKQFTLAPAMGGTFAVKLIVGGNPISTKTLSLAPTLGTICSAQPVTVSTP